MLTTPSPLMSPKIVGTAPLIPSHSLRTNDQVLAVDHAVVVEVARQNVELAGEGGDGRIADRDRDPVGLVDRLGQGDRIARPRAGDGDRAVVDACGTDDGDVAGAEGRGLAESDARALSIPSQGMSVFRPAGSSRSPSRAVSSAAVWVPQ